MIDSLGGRSKQMDIILYDRLNAPRFFPLPGIQVLPVETTYACGEVKAHLDSEKLEDCLDKCMSYKALKRAAYVESSSPTRTVFSLFGDEHEHWQSIFFCVTNSATSVDRLLRRYQGLVEHRCLRHDQGIDTLLSLETNGKRNFMCNVDGPVQAGVPSTNRSIFSESEQYALLIPCESTLGSIRAPVAALHGIRARGAYQPAEVLSAQTILISETLGGPRPSRWKRREDDPA